MSKEVNLIFPKESYDLIGCAFSVFNSMGYGHHERNYSFRKEVCVKVLHKEKEVGKYFLDFLINSAIVVELKVANDFHSNHIKQILTYLKVTNKRLGLLILFTPEGIKYRRIVN